MPTSPMSSEPHADSPTGTELCPEQQTANQAANRAVDEPQGSTPEPVSDPGSGLAQREVDEPFPWFGLRSLSTRQLRVMCNKAFKAMNSHFPPAEAWNQYQVLVDELTEREEAARSREDQLARPNTAFRDNALGSRFELYIDGTMAGWVKYSLRAGHMTLLDTMVKDDFDSHNAGVEEFLIRKALLNVHKRRLDLRVHCGTVASFLTGNPRFLALMPNPTAVTLFSGQAGTFLDAD